MENAETDFTQLPPGELLPRVYAELRRLAGAKLAREAVQSTLQPTALVHEAWLRLGGDRQVPWQNRRHFFGAAARAMEQILIERARSRRALRHGGGLQRTGAESLDHTAVEERDESVLAVGEALARFEAVDTERAELVRLRYFVGLTIEETAAAMDISVATAKRHWSFARAWLAREMSRT